MATTEDLKTIQDQIEKHVDILRHSFGLLEGDFDKLHKENEDIANFEIEGEMFVFGQLNKMRDYTVTTKDKADEEWISQMDNHLEKNIAHLHDAILHESATLADHISHHRDSHHGLHQEMAAFVGEIEEAKVHLDRGTEELLHQLWQIDAELKELDEKVLSTSADVAHSIEDTQEQILDKAASAFKDLLEGHHDTLLPGHFEQVTGNLTHAASDLSEQGSLIGANFQHELETLLQRVGEATQEAHANVRDKFQELIHDTTMSLKQQLVESNTAIAAGASITEVMGLNLHELAVMKGDTDQINEAIATFNKLHAEVE